MGREENQPLVVPPEHTQRNNEVENTKQKNLVNSRKTNDSKIL